MSKKSILVSDAPESVTEAIQTIIRWIGDDPLREGLVETPRRMIESFKEFYGGYQIDPAALLSKTFEEIEGYNDIVVLRRIPFISHCEHHMLPIIGTVSIGYLPDKRVVGISKLGHVVQAYSKRLQIQEKMTAQIADTIYEALFPRAVGVVIDADHSCMSLRGLKAHGISMVTRQLRGEFLTDAGLRSEFFRLIES